MKKISVALLTLLFLHSFARPSFALTEPPLFSCESPVGNTIADFNEGTHGIAGQSATFVGSDVVYSVDSDHVLQCFCPSDSNSGIQSNWAKLTDTSEETINYYQKLGWSYVPNGVAWGLDDSAYIVKNDYYSCHGDAGGIPISDSGSTSSSSNSNSSSNSSSGSTNGASTDTGMDRGGLILGDTLAFTGNDSTILLYIALGFGSAYLAYRLARE